VYIEDAVYKAFKCIARKYDLNLYDAINHTLLAMLMDEYPDEYMKELEGRRGHSYTV